MTNDGGGGRNNRTAISKLGRTKNGFILTQILFSNIIEKRLLLNEENRNGMARSPFSNY